MRLIDADALIRELNEKLGCRTDINKIICGMTVYEPAIVQPQWIPVAERMPQEHQIVVGWTKDNPFSRYREEVVTWNGKGWVFVYAQRYVTNVKYWMPLPEPHKPDVEEENT